MRNRKPAVVVFASEHFKALGTKAIGAAGNELFKTLSNVQSIKTIVAIGPAEYIPCWPGEYLIVSPDRDPHWIPTWPEGLSNEDALIVGLNSPFLHPETIELFIEHHDKSRKENGDPILTFRKTPDSDHLALMENGGIIIFHIHYHKGMINISQMSPLGEKRRSNVEVAVSTDSVVEMNLSGGDSEISVRCGARTSFSCSTAEFSGNASVPEANLYVDSNRARIEFKKDCTVDISTRLILEGLYSKIAYSRSPVIVPGILESDEVGERINLLKGVRIHGRQAFPHLFEPFCGMTIMPLLIKIDLMPFINCDLHFTERAIDFVIPNDEAILLSDDPFLSQFKLSTKSHPKPSDL